LRPVLGSLAKSYKKEIKETQTEDTMSGIVIYGMDPKLNKFDYDLWPTDKNKQWEQCVLFVCVSVCVKVGMFGDVCTILEIVWTSKLPFYIREIWFCQI
jgi:hypothetical protein